MSHVGFDGNAPGQLRWYVVQAVRNHEIRAATAIVAAGFESLLPILRRRRVQAGKLIDIAVPRFGVYIFARFNREEPGWQAICHGDVKRSGVVRILGRDTEHPSPVPDAAIDAIRMYEPEAETVTEPYRYSPGEPVLVHIGGRQVPGVFVAYRGATPMVETWIFGAERTVPVSAAEIEPQPLDGETKSVPICA